MEEIVIPNLEDDEEELALPSISRTAFGNKNGSTSSLPETLPYNHNHSNNSAPLDRPSKLSVGGGGGTTPTRPGFKTSASYSIGVGSAYTQEIPERPRLGKFSNGSSTSILTSGGGTSTVGSNTGSFLPKKGSLASFKNAFKANATSGNSGQVPPVPTGGGGGSRNNPSAGYPALRNPFSKIDAPGPSNYQTQGSSSSRAIGPHGSNSSVGGGNPFEYSRKYSIATTHSSHRSQGGRSITSAGSSSFRVDDQHHPIPALPPIPMRQTNSSRMGRQGSETGSNSGNYQGFGGYGGRRNGSIGGAAAGMGMGMDDLVEKTPGEEALRVVFRDFKELADAKLAKICSRPLNTQTSLPSYLESGIDPLFDERMTSVAHCGKRHARRIISLISSWCQSHCEGISASEVRSHLSHSLGLQMRVEDAAAILSSRKSSTAKYIYNRVLITLISVTPKEYLGEDLGMTLESNAFNGYRSEKVEDIVQFPHRKAVSLLQVELLGQLSVTRFLTVSDRFIRELTKLSTGPPTKESEPKIEHLLVGMRNLKLRVYPETELELSAEFIQSLSALFANSHGQTLKLAYAETFLHLLHPVIETATAEVNHPLWSKAIASILGRAQIMAQKPRYWNVAFPLVVVSLGVSPREVFLHHWQSSIEAITIKLKDRLSRTVAVNSFIRLLWVYLNRCGESITSTRKRLEQVLRIFFPQGQGSALGMLYPPEVPLEPYIQILHYTMARQLDYGEEFIGDFLRPINGSLHDHVLADRGTALIRALGMTLSCIEQERLATWPTSADFSVFNLEEIKDAGEPLSEGAAERSEVSSLKSKAGPAFVSLLQICDRLVGGLLLSNDAVNISAHASSTNNSNSEFTTRKNGDVIVMFPSRHEPVFKLYTAVLDAVPRCLGTETGFPAIANFLCRATFSADPAVCESAGAAMRRISQNPGHCLILVSTYREFVFDTRHIFRDTFIGPRLLESQFERIITLWLDLLKSLVHHSRLESVKSLSPGGEDSSELPKITSHMIDRYEGSALFLLCSTSLASRKLAGQILVCTRDLEGLDRKPSAPFRYSRILPPKSTTARSLQIYESNFDDAEYAQLRSLPWINSSDRQRLESLTAKDKSRLFQRIAESEYPKDGLLWIAVLPYFVSRLCESLTGPASELRITTIAIVLRLQGHVATLASGRTAMGKPTVPSRLSSDAAVLADHWRSYMSVLCVTMPSVSPMPATPPIQRTKEAVILTPDTIGSPALFHYLCSLLAWEDPRFKDAAVYALGTTGHTLLRPLCDVLLGAVRRLADGTKLGTPGAISQLNGNGTINRRSTIQGPLWAAVAHVFRLISPLLLDNRSQAHHRSNLSSTITFVKVTQALLSDFQVKEDYELQSLRRSFCIVVENLANALAKLDSSDRFFGEEARGAVFKLCYEWCHVGRRPDVAKARESQTLHAASEQYRGGKDRAQYLDDLQTKTKLLSAAAAEAMAGLCQGKLISADETTPAQQASEDKVEPLTVLRWIRGMFTSSSTSHHETARKALFALIKYNWACTRLIDEVLHQSFGEGEHFALECSFFGVIADILSEGLVQLPVEQVACLALSKLGHPVGDIRLRAFELAISLIDDPATRMEASILLPLVGGSSPTIYRNAQREMSEALAQRYADHVMSFLKECAIRLSQLEAPRREATLTILPAWMTHLDLVVEASDPPEMATMVHEALSKIMYMAIRFSDDHLEEIKAIFLSFAGSAHSPNVTALVKFLFEQGGKRKSPEFVAHAQKIMACLAPSPAGEIIFDEICGFIEPATMAAMPDSDVAPSPMASLADLDVLMSASINRSQAFSTGQLAFIFAGELLPHRPQDLDLSKRIPTLLHAALMHCDHTGSAIRESAQAMLFQLLRSWICDLSNIPANADGSATWSIAESKISALARDRASLFWKQDDIIGPETAFFAPARMTTLIMKILGIILPLQPNLRQAWGDIALTWASLCPMRHVACRSFQVFRILSPKPSPRMVSDSLARLSSTIGSSSAEIQSFNIEILRTFASVVQNLSMSEILNYPQVFWCTVACLTTPYEDEFAEVIELLHHVLNKTNLSDQTVVQLLASVRPAAWAGGRPYLQALLLVGLRSSKTSMLTFDLIRRLTSAQHDDFIDPPDHRLLHGFLAALPWMLYSTDLGEPNEDLAMMSLDLAAIADAQEHPSMSRLLTSFARNKFRSKDDFIRQAASLLRDFMASHALDVVKVLLAFVLNSEEWMREKAMQILILVLQHPEARAPLIAHGVELLQPLLRLVSTKHSAQALEILDMPITSSASAESLTTSMMASGDIFGSISPSGWSVPKAQDAAAMTRANVTAVFNTCAVETRAASAHFSVVQFSDYRGHPNYHASSASLDQFASPTAPGLQMSADNASIGDLVGALHSLEQFFDDGLEGSSPRLNIRGHGRRPSGSSDRKVRAILARGRNPSLTSPIYEHQPYPLMSSTSRHRHTASEMTSVSGTSSIDPEREPTQRIPQQYDPLFDGPLQRQTPWVQSSHTTGGSRHQTDGSLSSSAASDLDRSENLFGLDEVGNESSTSISQNSYGHGISGQSTPVMMKQRPRAGTGVAEIVTRSPRLN